MKKLCVCSLLRPATLIFSAYTHKSSGLCDINSMPLYKKKPFPGVENPADLSPDEAVFQVRFTKEIFRDYRDYLNRICFYRKRCWTCKVTGKINLTFEEALMSERRAIQKVHQFPTNLVAPVLREVQFCMLNLKDLVSMIAEKLQECMVEGSELYGRKNNRIYPCKIMKVLGEEADKTQYQVAWLDKEKKVTGNAVVDGNDLIKKKLPFTRELLKSFIRESTYRSVPWVLHDELAQKHGISTDPPEDVVPKLSVINGCVTNGKRKRRDEKNSVSLEKNKKTHKERNKENSAIDVDKNHDETKYPIDDLLVHPATNDPDIAQRPLPSTNFKIPMDCVGDLLMVWDFCTSFGRLLQLSPFSLEDFENAICHKESYVVLIVETHSAFLCSLMKDNGEYLLATQRKKRKPKITLLKWTEYLCDFLEMVGTDKFSGYLSTIRRGHYGLLDVSAKLGILRELVSRVLATELYREKLDEHIEERQALAAANREEALAEGRKRREAKDHKMHSNGMQAMTTEGRRGGSEGSNSSKLVTYDDNKQNEAIARREPTLSEIIKENSKTKKNVMEKKADDKTVVGMNHLTKKGAQEVEINDDRDIAGGKGLKQRKEYLAKEMEKRIIRTNPLGKDRYYNRYWFFRRDFRIYVESPDSTQWGYYSTKDELDSFIGSLNRKGVRERALKKELEDYYERICSGIQKKLKDSAAAEEADVRRSTRIRAPPRQNPALTFLKYENKWKED